NSDPTSLLSVGPLSAQGCRLAERKVSSAHYPKTDLSKRAAPPEFYEFGRWVLGHFSGLDIDVFGAVTLAEMWREDRSPRVRLPEAWGEAGREAGLGEPRRARGTTKCGNFCRTIQFA